LRFTRQPKTGQMKVSLKRHPRQVFLLYCPVKEANDDRCQPASHTQLGKPVPQACIQRAHARAGVGSWGKAAGGAASHTSGVRCAYPEHYHARFCSQGDYASYYPSISADGRYVAFTSLASNLVSGDTNESDDVFVHDRQGRNFFFYLPVTQNQP